MCQTRRNTRATLRGFGRYLFWFSIPIARNMLTRISTHVLHRLKTIKINFNWTPGRIDFKLIVNGNVNVILNIALMKTNLKLKHQT
ncbi:hypothetical protein Hanom_Chr02g00096711 [Helianthus anomalus]